MHILFMIWFSHFLLNFDLILPLEIKINEIHLLHNTRLLVLVICLQFELMKIRNFAEIKVNS